VSPSILFDELEVKPANKDRDHPAELNRKVRIGGYLLKRRARLSGMPELKPFHMI
jgi:hypothetical protein